MHPLNVCLQGDDEFLLQHIRSDTISCVIQSLLTNYVCTCVCVSGGRDGNGFSGEMGDLLIC